MTVTVTALKGQPYRQVITAGNHTFYADTRPDNGGQDTAPNPHELLLGALGACTSMTLQMYARCRGYPLEEVSVKLDEGKAQTASGTVPSISKTIELKGPLSQQELDDLKRVAEKCPVNKLITGDKQMNSVLNLIA